MALYDVSLIGTESRSAMIFLPKADKIAMGNVLCNVLLTLDGVLLIELHGIVTARAFMAAMASLQGLSLQAVRGFCIYADKAMAALSDSDLDHVGTSVLPHASGALVVKPEATSVMRQHALRVARSGVVRKVFTSRGEAWEWALHQVQLSEAQERWEMVRCPGL